MKSFLLVFFIGFVQICMSASIGNEIDDDSVKGFDIVEILSHQNEWKADHDIKEQDVDDLVNIFEQFKENCKDSQVFKGVMDLLNIVLNEDVAEDKQVKLQVTTTLNNTDSSVEKCDKSSKSNDDDSSGEIIVRLAGELLPIEDSTELDKVLTGKLNDSQKARAMKYFGANRSKVDREFENVMTNLMKDAIIVTLGDKYTFKDNQVVLKAVEGNRK